MFISRFTRRTAERATRERPASIATVFDLDDFPQTTHDILSCYRHAIITDQAESTNQAALARTLFEQLDLPITLLDHVEQERTKKPDLEAYYPELVQTIQEDLDKLQTDTVRLSEAFDAVDAAFNRLHEIGDSLRACGYIAANS